MLVGLAGAAGSGKDTVYGMLRTLSFEGSLLPYIVRRDAFADRLKISAARALGVEGSNDDCIDFCDGLKSPGIWVVAEAEPRHPSERGQQVAAVTGREYLQRYGTEAHRDVFGQQFWIKAVLPEGYPSDVEREKTLLVVTDVRFPNEAERVRECGGQNWRVVRPGTEIEESAHASEQALDDDLIDYTIVNDGDKGALFERVKVAVLRKL